MSKMMICPNWRECKEYCQRKAPHKCSQLIGDGTLCKKASWKRDECNNTCTPYIPEQPKKPVTCDHLWASNLWGTACVKCGIKSNESTADLKPEPEMPLIEGWDIDKRLDDFKTIAERLDSEGYHTRANSVRYLIERCKRAEAHDSAVASKARQFLVAKIIGRYADTLSPEAIRDIRAMAEGEE